MFLGPTITASALFCDLSRDKYRQLVKDDPPPAHPSANTPAIGFVHYTVCTSYICACFLIFFAMTGTLDPQFVICTNQVIQWMELCIVHFISNLQLAQFEPTWIHMHVVM